MPTDPKLQAVELLRILDMRHKRAVEQPVDLYSESEAKFRAGMVHGARAMLKLMSGDAGTLEAMRKAEVTYQEGPHLQ